MHPFTPYLYIFIFFPFNNDIDSITFSAPILLSEIYKEVGTEAETEAGVGAVERLLSMIILSIDSHIEWFEVC